MEEITDFSLDILGRFMNLIPLLTNKILIKCLIIIMSTKSMFSITPCKKCYIIKLVEIIEFMSFVHAFLFYW